MMLQVEWRQIAGYPSAAFCATHDRLIEPIILTDADGGLSWGCPYCAEETMSHGEAKSKTPEPLGFFHGHKYSPISVTYYCPKKGCRYNTTDKGFLEIHERIMHGASAADKMKCSEGLCDNDAFDFCAQCESAMCKDHMDWKDMCPACGANVMWPNF